MDVHCLICASPYLRATVNRLFYENNLTPDQIATLVQVPLLAVVLHEREIFLKHLERIEANSIRLEKAMEAQARRIGLQLTVDELPMTSQHRLELTDGKTVTMTIHFEEESA